MLGVTNLVLRINNEPSLLFLGHNSQGLGINNRFLENAIRIMGINEKELGSNLSYAGLLGYLGDIIERSSETSQASLRERFLQDLQRADEQSLLSEEVDQILSIGWSGVFTSLVDTSLFRCTKKQLQKIIDKSECKQNYLSKKNLHVTCLFGNLFDKSKYPPLTYDEKNLAETPERDFLSLISQCIKGYGVMIIDGWDPETDFVRTEDLLMQFVSFQKESLYIFSATEKMKQDRLLKSLVNKKIAVLESQSLYQCLKDAHLLDSFDEELYGEDDEEEGIPITAEVIFNGKILQRRQYLSYQIYNQLDSNITVLDDSVLTNPDYADKEEFFLRFLSTGTGVPLWGGYASNFYFKRDVDEQLLKVVKEELENYDISRKCVIRFR